MDRADADDDRGVRQPAGPWHALDTAEALEAIGSGPNGLGSTEARARLRRFGRNRLPAAAPPGAVLRFLRQFHSLLIYVLLGSAGLAAVIGHAVDAAVIVAVVVINAVVGFVQEGRAERALDAIRGMIDPLAAILRDGRRLTVKAEEVVPGDVVLLEAGDRVPADLRLLRGRGLRIDEALITGESVPVDKGPAAVPETAVLGDRTSMAFSGTLVVAGQAAGVVVATGSATELGRISAMLGAVERVATPLIRQMDQFARQVTVAVLAASGAVFLFAALVRAYAWPDAFMAVVGLAVAAIPEGLPAVMTIALAVGVQRMASRNAILRRLPAVETLGSVSVICSDKTGTLTRNEMMVSAVALAGADIAVDGVGYRPEGGFATAGGAVDPPESPVLEELALAGALCNDADLRQQAGEWIVDGDPLEGALLTLAMKAGHDLEAARLHHPRLDAIPFDARHRFMATLHDGAANRGMVYVKGAPEAVIAMCEAEALPGTDCPIDRGLWNARVEFLARQGLRVIAIARGGAGEGRGLEAGDLPGRLTLLGLVGLIDPPRPEAVQAVAECRAAGIRVKMITGDHAATAQTIARQLGLAEDPRTLTGQQLDELPGDAFRDAAREAAVFARATPEQKLRLVEALQADHAVVAMTGDGVNDAPALKRADVGVAMGQKGTEAAKEASEMVLADDNFASIVAAVREGRTVYDNITKVIAWTLPTNGGEAFTIILAILFGLTMPVTPVQILWVNMVTAVALGLTLAFEPTEPGAMRRPPREAGERLLSGRLLWRILFVSALMVAGTFGIYLWAIARGLELDAARTLVVNTLVVMEIFYLFSVRFVHGTSLTWQGVAGTPAVLIGVAVVVAAQLAFTYLPPLQSLFGTRPVGPAEGAAAIGVGVILLVLVEVEKRVGRAMGGGA